MNIRKAHFLLIVFSLLITSNNSFGMEERPSGLRWLGDILLGWIPVSALFDPITQPETEGFSFFSDLPEEIRTYVIQLLIAGATGGTLAESAGAIHSLAQVNKEWNAFFNDMDFSCALVKSFAQRFNCSEEIVCVALSTKAAKEYLHANIILLQGFSHRTSQQYPKTISCDLPNDINFRVNSLGDRSISPNNPPYNTTNYPIFIPLFPGGANLIMYLYKHSSHEAIDRIINQQCPIHINLANNNGTTALMFAVQNYHGITSHLLSHFPDANIDQQDNNGNTALLYALQTSQIMEGESGSRFIGKISVTIPITPSISNIKALLKYGADPQLANFDGLTPLEAALNTEDDAIVQLIKDAIVTTYGQPNSSSSSSSQE